MEVTVKQYLGSDELISAFEKYIEEFIEEADVEVFKKMKLIMDAQFGKDNNQIKRPNLKDVVDTFSIHYRGQEIREYYASTKNNPAAFKQYIDRWFKTCKIGFDVIIKFPQVTITNSRGESHIIKDLYVSTTFDKQGKILTSLYGTRGTITTEELAVGYAHSHLHATNFIDYGWDNFCLGTGEINQVTALMRVTYTEADFTLFCMHLKEFVKWESLEGVPHIKLSSVYIQENQYNLSLSSGQLEIIAIFLFRWLLILDLDFNTLFDCMLTADKLNIAFNEESHKILADKVSHTSPEAIDTRIRGLLSEHLLVRKNQRGECISLYTDTQRTPNRTDRWKKSPLFTFKNEEIKLNVINNVQEKEQIQTTIKNKIYVHPTIESAVCAKISTIFQKDIITNQVFEGGDTFANIR